MKYNIEKIGIDLRLGEGCIWDEKRNRVFFLDIEGFKIYSYSVESERIEKIDTCDYVGCIVLDESNNLVAAVRDKLIQINPETKEKDILLEIKQPEFVRFNDGKCDKYGKLWAGTMAIDQSLPNAKGTGKLYCIKDNNVLAQYDNLTIPNGLAWNEAGDKFYHIDTATNQIAVYDVVDEGIITNRKIVVQIDKKEGSPDGMCMDTEGNLWVAMWGGFKVNCYNPDTGKKLEEILFPDKNVSCCTFCGKELDTLYVTTAQDEKGICGGIYVVRGIGQKGKSAYKYIKKN